MQSQRPMTVEPLAYRMVAEDIWPRIVRVLAIVGLVVGISRLFNAVLYLWANGILGPSPFGGSPIAQSPLVVLRILPVFVSGPMIVIAACGMLMNQRWGAQLAVVSEYISLAAFPILLAVIPFQMRGNPPAIFLYQLCSAVSGMMASLAFPILLILILRIHKTVAAQSMG